MNEKNKPAVLLINPWVYDFAAFDLYLKPLGLLYISSHLKKAGVKVRFIDCMHRLDNYFVKQNLLYNKKYGTGKFYYEIIEKPEKLKFVPRKYKRYGLPYSVVKERLNFIRMSEKIDAILITGIMTYWYLAVFDMIKLVKKIFPDTPVLLGGIYPTLMPEHSKRFSCADYVITGNNLKYTLETIFKIINFSPLQQNLPEDFSEWEEPDYNLYETLSYIVVLTSIGCPFKCTYCATPLFYPVYKYKDYKKVINTIEKFNVKDVAFYDDALLFNFEKNLKVFLSKIIESGIKVNFHTPNGVHIRFITKEVAEFLYKANFRTLRLSFETADEKRQKDTGNKATTEELKRAIRYLTESGFSREDIEVYILVGFPDQSKQEVIDSINIVKDLGAIPRIVEYAPIPGTYEYKKFFGNTFIEPLFHNNSIFFAKYSNFDWDDMRHFRVIAKNGGRRI